MQRKLPALRALAAQLLAAAVVALACHFGAAWLQFHPTLLAAAAALPGQTGKSKTHHPSRLEHPPPFA